MIFWESCEADKLAFFKVVKVAVIAEPYLNEQFGYSSLASLQVKLRYIPIIMDEQGRANHPERSKARIKQGIYDCAPQLNYRTFVDGTLEAQCVEYVRGIALSSPHLKKFGATSEQIADFDKIMIAAPQQLYRQIVAMPDK
jgi:hypothetical protein